MRKATALLFGLLLANVAFAPGMLEQLNRVGHDIHLFVVAASALLIIFAGLSHFGFKKKTLSMFLLALSSLILLFPITSCFFLTHFVNVSCEFSPCSQDYCQGHCKELGDARETGGIVGLEAVSFLIILVGTLSFVSSKGKQEQISVAILAVAVILLLFIAYRVSSPEFVFQCSGMPDCRDYSYCTCP